MRTTRIAGWGVIGTTAAALATLGVVGGFGLQGGGITVVGANPAAVPVVYAASASTATATPSAAQGDAAILQDKGEGTAAATTRTVLSVTSTSAGSTVAAATASDTSPAVVTTASSTATATTTPAGGACTAAVLHLQVTGYAGPTGIPNGSTNALRHAPVVVTRTQLLTLTFTNVSHANCTLRGYPSVDFLRGGIRGPLSAPDTFASVPHVTDVQLSPGGVATAEFTFTANGIDNPRGLRCEQVVAVRVYAPGSVKSLSSAAHDSSGHRIPAFYVCGHGVIVHAVQHG